MHLRPAEYTDFPLIKDFFEQGRLFQQSLGFTQWLPGYPSLELFREDCEQNRGFVIECDNVPIGYVVIDLKGDKEYDRLSYIWEEEKPYGVVHRMVLNDNERGKGRAGELLKLIEKIVLKNNIGVLRFDTGIFNTPMQRLLRKAGYVNLGKHNFVWGERLAYEKNLLKH